MSQLHQLDLEDQPHFLYLSSLGSHDFSLCLCHLVHLYDPYLLVLPLFLSLLGSRLECSFSVIVLILVTVHVGHQFPLNNLSQCIGQNFCSRRHISIFISLSHVSLELTFVLGGFTCPNCTLLFIFFLKHNFHLILQLVQFI